MKKYLDIEIEREHSKYPRGLKHFSKTELFENTLFDIDIILHKAKGIWKGHEDGKRDKDRSEEKDTRSAKEVLRRFMLGLLYEDRDSENRSGENRGIEERYIEIAEREQESAEQGNQRSLEE